MTSLISNLNNLPAEFLLPALYVSSLLMIWLAHRLMGKTGLILFCGLAVVVVNLQVLKIIPISVFSAPVAMGTILMMSTFFSTDILAELYGREAANRAVLSGFYAMLFVSLFMLITISIKPYDDGSRHNQEIQNALTLLFLPTPSLLVASLGAYLTSQFFDVAFFLKLKKALDGRYLRLRSLVSTALSSLIDTLVFSLLAWRVFAVVEIDTDTLIYAYIIGTYVLRLGLGSINALLLPLLTRAMQKQPS